MSSPKPADAIGRLERRLARERTARKRAEELLETRARELFESKKALEDAYSATVEVFASLVGGKSGRSASSLRALARDARRLAKLSGLDAAQAQTVYLAALLCELGKLALPDDVVGKPLTQLTPPERKAFCTHPRLAYEALMVLPPLEAVAKTILHHCELFSGKGYPDRLSWDEISTESKVLCVVKDFDALRRGILLPESLTETEALEYLQGQRDIAYSAELVDRFTGMLRQRAEHEEGLKEMRLAPRSLRAGMSLTRDLTNDGGVLILPAETELDDALVAKLQGMANAGRTVVYVALQDDEAAPDAEHEGEAAA